MGAKWFLVKTKFTDTDPESGDPKNFTEANLVDAISYTEAEARITEIYVDIRGSDFTIDTVSKQRFSNIIYDETAEDWYKCKAVYESFDDSAQREKKINEFSLIQAKSLDDCLKKLKDFYKDTQGMVDLDSMVKTAILDVYPYTGPPRKENTAPKTQTELDFEKKDKVVAAEE